MAKINLGPSLGKADVHIHSRHSDGGMSIADILQYVENKTDLNVIAICDHDTLEGVKEARQLMKEKPYHFELIAGEEITSREGHILGLFLQEAIPPNLSAREVLERIRAQGGVSVASHPFYHSRMNNAQMVTMDGVGATTLIQNQHLLDGIEIVNATPTLGDENVAATILNKTILFAAEVGGSDAHILEAIGMGYTLFEGQTAAQFKKAILTHQTRAIFEYWTILALLKYLFFYFPLGLRLIINTIIHGRHHRKPDPLEQSIRQEEKNYLRVGKNR